MNNGTKVRVRENAQRSIPGPFTGVIIDQRPASWASWGETEHLVRWNVGKCTNDVWHCVSDLEEVVDPVPKQLTVKIPQAAYAEMEIRYARLRRATTGEAFATQCIHEALARWADNESEEE